MTNQDDGLCEYERQRLAHIARNHEYLVRLGIMEAKEELAPQAKEKKKSAPRKPRNYLEELVEVTQSRLIYFSVLPTSLPFC